MKKGIRNAAFSAAAIILFFGFLELSAGFLNPLLKINHGSVRLGIGGKDVLEYPSGYLKDKDLFWRLDPLLRDYNSFGFRDRELSQDKDRGVFRVICMGDSVTFGWPADIKDTYPKILEGLLSSHFPERKFEVFNAGVPGYTSYQGLIWLKKDLIKLRPDLIIVYYGANDMGGSYKPDKEQKALPAAAVNAANFLRKSEFYKLYNRMLLYLKYPPGEEGRDFVERVSPDDYRANLEEMRKISEDNGARALFINHPVFYDPEGGRVTTDERYAFGLNTACLDLYGILKGLSGPFNKFFIDDMRPFNVHLSKKGHKVLAENIFGFLNNSIMAGDILQDK